MVIFFINNSAGKGDGDHDNTYVMITIKMLEWKQCDYDKKSNYDNYDDDYTIVVNSGCFADDNDNKIYYSMKIKTLNCK